jgi:uncharacterized membrane protein
VPFVLLGMAVVLGGVLGVLFASTPRRLVALVALAAIAVLALVVARVLTAPSEQPEVCPECGEYFGRWLDPVVFVVTPVYALLFALGAIVGSTLRQRSAQRPTGAG